MMDATCLFDSRIDWWLLLITLLLLFVTLFPTRHMTGCRTQYPNTTHSLLAIMISDTPRQGPHQDLHTITHNSATMASILQDSKVLFPSYQGCTALISSIYLSLSTGTLVLQGSLKAILV